METKDLLELLTACQKITQRQQKEIKELRERLESRTDGWISVEDRLPEDNTEVLAYYRVEQAISNYAVGHFQQGKEYFFTVLFSHWQPLPPPQGDI